MAKPGVTGLFCALDLRTIFFRVPNFRETGKVLHSQAGAGSGRCSSTFTGRCCAMATLCIQKFFIPDGNRRLSHRSEAWPETRNKSRAGGTP